MSPNPVTARPATDAVEARDLMSKFEIGALPVVDDTSRLVGIVTRADLLRHDPATLSDCMSRAVITVCARDDLADAARLLLGYGMHHLVVVGHDRVPIGILSVRDVARAGRGLAPGLTVASIMTRHLLSVPAETPLWLVRNYLGPNGLRAVLVTDDARGVVGVFTRTNAIAAARMPGETPIASIMRTAVDRVPADTPLADVANRLGRARGGPLLVQASEDGRRQTVGVVTATDLTAVIAETPPQATLTCRDHS